MSLYRQPARARASILAAVAAVALLVGGGIGFAIGRSSAPEPSAREVVDRLAEDLGPAVNGLELLPREYAQAASGSGNEIAGVEGGLRRIRAAVDAAHDDLVVLDPARTRRLNAAVLALEGAVRSKAPPARVQQLAEAASAVLAQVPGGRGS